MAQQPVAKRSKSSRAPSGAATTSRQRALQGKTDARERVAPPAKPSKRAVQAGARRAPSSFPPQHLRKPGRESDLVPQPAFIAPDYLGSGKLQDRVAIITGGDSGIGRAVATLFAREGANVAIIFLGDMSDALETQKVVEGEGRQCLLIEGDVTRSKFCVSAVRKTVKRFGRLDILVNNAGFQLHAESIEDISEDQFDLTLKTNVYGYFHMAKAAMPYLTEGSAIINSGSETALFGHPKLLDYSTTKGAIHAFTRALATNVISRGIRVNAVAPGPVWTPLNPADASAKNVATFGKSTDMRRAAQPEEIAPAYVFLASPVCSGYITGIVLPVMGGTTGSL